MTTINAAVTEGYVFAEDATGKVQLTKDRLNLQAKPTVTVDIGGSVAAEDLAADSVTAAKLADALADLLPGAPTLTVGTENGSSQIVVSLQLKDIQDNDLSAKRHFSWWVSDAEAGIYASPVPTGNTVITVGVELEQHTAKVFGEAITSASGTCDIQLEDSGAKSFYLNVAIQGIIASVQVTFA